MSEAVVEIAVVLMLMLMFYTLEVLACFLGEEGWGEGFFCFCVHGLQFPPPTVSSGLIHLVFMPPLLTQTRAPETPFFFLCFGLLSRLEQCLRS